MWESVTAPMVSIAAAAVLIAPTPTPTSRVDATPVLTTTPFGALPGQLVTHTITISGTATLTAGRITFTTTAELDDLSVHATPGRCAVSALTVTCDLGDVRLAAGTAPPRVTITGRIQTGAAPDGLVRNRVTLTSAEFADDDAQVASNAYLLPGSAPTSAKATLQEIAATDPPHRRSTLTAALVALVAAALVVGGALLVRHRRRPGDPPPQTPPPATSGRSDPM